MTFESGCIVSRSLRVWAKVADCRSSNTECSGFYRPCYSIVRVEVLEVLKSLSSRILRTNLQVLVLDLVQQVLVHSLSLDDKVLENIQGLKIFKDFAFCQLSVMYDHVTSVNSVTATVHEDTVKNVLLTY